jgi:hypothetical protein
MYLKSVGGLTSILLILACLCAASAIEIANLEVNSGLAYEVTENLGVGDKEYTDRDYTLTSMPDYLVGLTWIRTANNDKQNPDLEVSFEIDREAYVYILWVARDPAAQDWLQDNYTLLEGDEVGSTDEPLAVYKSNTPFAAGEVKTYAANTGAGLYVIVLEETATSSVKASGKLATTWSSIKRN